MALLFMDSFDHYATADILAKWTGISGTPTITAGSGRNGSAAMVLGSTFQLFKTLVPTGALFVCGFAVKLTTLFGAQRIFLGVGNGGIAQVGVHFNTDGTLGVSRGFAVNNTPSPILGTTTFAMAAGTFYHLQVKFLLDDTVGTAELRVNGVSVLALTGLDTNNAGGNAWNTFTLYSNVASLVLDDLYILDGSGAAPWNDFLGDCRVDARFPTAAGATTGWTPSAGANWAAVDDAAPNADTDYVAALTSPLTDTYVVQDAPSVGSTIYGVQHCLSAKKMDAGIAMLAPVIRHSGVDYPGANLSPSTGYGYLLQVAQTNPGTSAQWTESGFNNAEFGCKRTA